MWARYIGYWKSDGHPLFLTPQYFIGTWRPEEKAKVVSYLQSGHIFCDQLKKEKCLMCEYLDEALDLTDGAWIWPKLLIHYVQEHNVLLPIDVVRKWAAINFTMPEYKGIWEVSWIYWQTHCDFMQGKPSKDYRR